MPLTVNVTGGTNAGRRRTKITESWHCACTITLSRSVPRGLAGEIHGPTVHTRSLYEARETGTTMYRVNPGDRYSCPDCGSRRPTRT